MSEEHAVVDKCAKTENKYLPCIQSHRGGHVEDTSVVASKMSTHCRVSRHTHNVFQFCVQTPLILHHSPQLHTHFWVEITFACDV